MTTLSRQQGESFYDYFRRIGRASSQRQGAILDVLVHPPARVADERNKCMSKKLVLLWSMPDELMLIVEHPSGVRYQNQVGGNVCWQADLEGVLCPLDVDREFTERIQNCPYPGGKQGISSEIADTIDALLASDPGTSFVKVDRTRLGQSWEAWVYVEIDSPESSVADIAGTYSGPIYGFGAAKGVLTWPNSD